MNAPYHPIQTVADVMAMIAQAELPEQRKRDLLSAMRRVSAIIDSDPQSLKLDVPALRKALDAVRPAAHRMTPRTFSNLRSLFTAALALAKVADTIDRRAAKTSPAWALLVKKIAGDKRLSTGLTAFMNWCAKKGIEPGAVDDAAVQAFLCWLETRTLRARVRQRARETVNIWNEAAARVPGWPPQRLTRVSFRPVSPNLKWEELPPTFGQEADAYLALRAEPDVFDSNPNAPTKELAPSTLRLHQNHIRLAASVLVRSGMPVEELQGLADLVTVKGFTTVLRHYLKGNGGEPNSFVNGLAKTLIDVAIYAVRVPEEQQKELRRLANKLPPVPFDLTEKNKRFLREVESEEVHARLLFLADDLMHFVRAELRGGRLRLVQAQIAVAIAILLVAPLRPQNLIELSFSRHFKEPEGARGKLILRVPKEATKSKKRDLTFEFSPDLAEPIRWYRREILPRLGGEPSGDLFVSEGGGRKSQETLSQQLTQIVGERVGIHMTPHQFRHLSAYLYLEAHPEDFQSITDLLGHGWSKTTRIYAGCSGRRASKVYGNYLLEQRRLLELRGRRRRLKKGPGKVRGKAGPRNTRDDEGAQE